MDVKIFTSIDDIPSEVWDRLVVGASCSCSREFWQVVESAKLNDFDYRFALIHDAQDKPVALASFYTITTDIAVFSSPALRSVLERIRKRIPNFFKLRILECGTPLTANPPVLMPNREQGDAIVEALSNKLLAFARSQRIPVIAVRDFQADAAWLRPSFERRSFRFVNILPNTLLEICWPTMDEYLASMKSYYRSKLLRHLRKINKRSIRCELREDFDDLAALLCKQWMTVHNQADEFKREVLSPEFYRDFSKKLGERSKVLLFFQDKEIVGHALLLLDGDMLRWLYFGRKVAVNDSLYLFAGYKVVETAIDLKVSRLELGFTTYSVKRDFGAEVHANSAALCSPYRFVNPLLCRSFALFNKIPEIDTKSVFKDRPVNDRRGRKQKKPDA